MSQRTLRRLPSTGWEETTSSSGGRRVVLDTGVVLTVAEDALVGTAEAAALLGVRPPNFIRDWAALPDFPAPVAELASGRIWRAADIVSYRERRRRPKPTPERLDAIARKVAWWDPPERTRARPGLFIARVLATGSVEDVVDVTAAYGRAALARAVTEAPSAILGQRARHYWELVLDLPHTTAPAARTMG